MSAARRRREPGIVEIKATKANRLAPVLGRWYIPRTDPKRRRRGIPKIETQGPRWVLGVSRTHVLYSRGGSQHYESLIETFKRWVRATRASAGRSKKGFKWGVMGRLLCWMGLHVWRRRICQRCLLEADR